MIDTKENRHLIHAWKVYQVAVIVTVILHTYFSPVLVARLFVLGCMAYCFYIAEIWKRKLLDHTRKIERHNRIERAVEMRWKE